MEMSLVQKNIQKLLNSTAMLHEGYRQAKIRYASQVAPDFKLFQLFNINENTLSRCLAYLLDPQEDHAQGDLFLSSFYNSIELTESISINKSTQVFTEYTILNKRRIDIYIASKEILIGIENKPWAADQIDQLYDYSNWLANEAKKKNSSWLMVYLCNNEINDFTLRPETPQDLRRNIIQFTFYQLAEWLAACAPHIKAPQVRCFVDALIQFTREDINGETNVDYEKELTENVIASPQNLNAAFLIAQSMRKVKEQLWLDFLSYLKKELQPKGITLNYNNQLLTGRKEGDFHFYFSGEDDFTLCWQFEKPNYCGFCWGISSSDIMSKKNQRLYFPLISEAMNNIYPELEAHTRKEGWWPWWTYADESMHVPRNWGMDPDAWSLLVERGEGSFAQSVINIVIKVQAEINLKLFSVSA